MELIIFCITITTLVVFSMFGLGIAIRKECGKHERNAENHRRQSSECEHYNSSVLCSGSSDLLDSSVGNIHRQESSGRNIQTTQCYENGEITNLCAIIALKTILREYRSLSNIEKDAINKGTDSIISMEKLNNYINNKNSIDIEEYI